MSNVLHAGLPGGGRAPEPALSGGGVMKKLINSVDSAINDALAGRDAGSRVRWRGRTRGASVTALTGLAAAPAARTVDDAQRPELTRSRGVRVDIPALRWGR
jgi:hypothetical protein